MYCSSITEITMSATELNARRKPQCTAVVLSGGSTPGKVSGVRATAESVFAFELLSNETGLLGFTVTTDL